MKASAIVTGVVATLAIGGGTVLMLTGATPYMTCEQARHATGDRLNVVGDIVKDSVKTDRTKSSMTFKLRDPDGAEITVHYSGEPIANMPAAQRIVAMGSLKDGEIYSDKLLIKCPSKYEETRQVGSVAQR